MKKENERICNFINEYHDFLSANHIDIAHSLTSNSWFVYHYVKEYGYYEYFIRFSTVSQLVDIILDEMRFELYCAIEKETSSPKCEDHELTEQIEDYYKDKNSIPELTALLDIVSTSDLGKNSKFFQNLDKLYKTHKQRKWGKSNFLRGYIRGVCLEV